MKILDQIVFNRLIKIIAGFILAIIKIFTSQQIDNLSPKKPVKKLRLKRRKENE